MWSAYLLKTPCDSEANIFRAQYISFEKEKKKQINDATIACIND